MTELFVPYEESKALRDLGFEEDCLGYYNVNDDFELKVETELKIRPHYEREIYKKHYPENVPAPLYSQGFKWFKKKYDIDVNICFRTETEGARVCAYSFEYVYPISHKPRWEGETHDMYLDWVRISKDGYRYKSSEEAELACLKKLIQITKQK